jgi:hypothetical protein
MSNLLVAAGQDIALLDSKSKLPVRVIESAQLSRVTAMANCGQVPYMLATGGEEGFINFYDLRKPDQLMQHLVFHPRAITGLQFTSKFPLMLSQD